MKNLFLILFIGLLPCTLVKAQNKTANSLIGEGVELYDAGKYSEAVKKYEEALKIEPGNTLALLEASLAYTNLKQYKKCIEYCDQIIASQSEPDHIVHAYMNKGTAYDLSGEKDKAIETYKAGLKIQPGAYLLYYNLGYTYLTNQDIENAELNTLKALSYNPEHSSSNYLLGYTQYYKNDKVRTMLPFYYFLALEPNSQRSSIAYKLLNEMAGLGVTKESTNKINISVDFDTTDNFHTADTYISLHTASVVGEDAKKSDFENFYELTKGLTGILAETVEINTNSDLFSNVYVRFLKDLSTAEYMETYCRIITISAIPESLTWVKNNTSKVSEFHTWFEEYVSNNSQRNEQLIEIR